MLTQEKREALLRLSTALVADAMDRLGLAERVAGPAIRPVAAMTKMAGTAVTVRIISQPDVSRADLAGYHQAFEMGREWCCPIMTIAVDPKHHHQGIFGDGAARMGLGNGFVGALIDGAVRDTAELAEMGFVVFSRTISPGFTGGKVEAVGAGEPVTVGRVEIRTGDIVLGDNDGVVAIGASDLDAVLAKAEAIREWEVPVHKLIEAGCSSKEAVERVGEMP
ncbi:MAG: RraA family protein [Phycisphaerae bacterium]|nr:RraA family protein [Phycisphaerae bacterium]